MTPSDIKRWDRRARSKYAYVNDPEGVDTWRSHAERVLADRAWTGDCDDLASTTLDLMLRDGLPSHRAYRLVVRSEQARAKAADHMIAAAVDDEGRYWVVGDTFGSAHDARDTKHRGFLYHRVDEFYEDGSPIWREGLPWKTYKPT